MTPPMNRARPHGRGCLLKIVGGVQFLRTRNLPMNLARFLRSDRGSVVDQPQHMDEAERPGDVLDVPSGSGRPGHASDVPPDHGRAAAGPALRDTAAVRDRSRPQLTSIFWRFGLPMNLNSWPPAQVLFLAIVLLGCGCGKSTEPAAATAALPAIRIQAQAIQEIGGAHDSTPV